MSWTAAVSAQMGLCPVTASEQPGEYDPFVASEAAVGFWSYTHEDDKLDGGAILKLADLISEEYDLISGEPLQLFVDRKDIAWGEEWHQRIDEALSQTTFFIPIVTPRYFNRPECRRELLEFTAKAKSLGVEELVLPILYVDVKNFSSENPDEAVALVARMQYEDWRTTRLLEPTSREYRTFVNTLARRLLDIAGQVSQRQFERELSADPDTDEIDGISDIMAKMPQTLNTWLDFVQGEKINEIQMEATWHELWARVLKLRQSHAPASAILATQIRIAKEVLPLLERAQREWEGYAAKSVELDPLVSAVARQVKEHPETYELAISVRAAISEAMAQIKRIDDHLASGGHTIGVHLEEMRHLGRIFQQCAAIYRKAVQARKEGDDIVRRWDVELRLPPATSSIDALDPGVAN
jgi:hypothetical protein